jgi:hypothetical protein
VIDESDTVGSHLWYKGDRTTNLRNNRICRTVQKKLGRYYKYCTYFFINMVLDFLLPSVQLQSFLEWTLTSFEQSVAEFYTILLEHLQVALEMLEMGICSSL